MNTIKDKYPFLLLGLTVLLILYLIVSGIFSGKQQDQTNKKYAPTPIKQEARQDKIEIKGTKYVVKPGESLWKIAENTYGSGYNAYDIARANNLTSPGAIEKGQELILPTVSPKPATKGDISAAKTDQVTITGAQYTVQQGDYLWKIALEAYGDGYAWTRIASANRLSNPDIIHTGNVLIIPR